MIKEINCTEAWSLLKNDPNSYLVDVRTKEEWLNGRADLSSLNKKLITISWLFYNNNEIKYNGSFFSELSQYIDNKKNKILFICKSGVRSRAAAAAAFDVGFVSCYNIIGGFNNNNNNSCNSWAGSQEDWQAARLPSTS